MKRIPLTRALFPTAVLFAAGAFAAPPPEHPMAREPENEQSTSTLGQMAPRDEQSTTSSTTDPTEQPSTASDQTNPTAQSDEPSTSASASSVQPPDPEQASLHSSSNSSDAALRPKTEAAAAQAGSTSSSAALSSQTSDTDSTNKRLEASDRAAAVSNERSTDSSSSGHSDTVDDSSSISRTATGSSEPALSVEQRTLANDRAPTSTGIGTAGTGTGTGTTDQTVSTERLTSISGEPAAAPSAAESTNISMAAIKANFDAFDKQGKGYITRGDAASDPHLTAEFDTLDSDHDGKLTVTEYMSAHDVATFRPQQGVDKSTKRE